MMDVIRTELAPHAAVSQRPTYRNQGNGGRLLAIGIVAGLHVVLLLAILTARPLVELVLPVTLKLNLSATPKPPPPPPTVIPPQLTKVSVVVPIIPVVRITPPPVKPPPSAPPTPDAISQPSAPAPKPAPPVPPGLPVLDLYKGEVLGAIEQALEIPDRIRMAELAGATLVEMRLSPSGELLESHILQSSGIAAIDNLALETVRDTSYPPFLARMPQQDTSFSVLVKISTQ